MYPEPCPCGQSASVRDYGSSHGTTPWRWYYVLSSCGWHQGEPVGSEREAVEQWNAWVRRCR